MAIAAAFHESAKAQHQHGQNTISSAFHEDAKVDQKAGDNDGTQCHTLDDEQASAFHEAARAEHQQGQKIDGNDGSSK